MGRYYKGFIEGKFLFGIQSSNCADRFGFKAIYAGNVLIYEFDENHLFTVEQEIKKIEAMLGNEDTIKKFFYSFPYLSKDEKIKSGITCNDVSNYADLLIGRQIFECIKQKGSCYFDTEL